MTASEKAFLGEKVAWVAAAIQMPEEFRKRAKLATEELGAKVISLLPDFFHQPPRIPENAKIQFSGLGFTLLGLPCFCYV
ncbi:hypothetical protein KSD_85550 [Ktedonobacter sp. SOSP1-85]|uniref:hypothetical protein n=1 Tax=Ktedonobacter sp. SOSP1-85 TaxID=2778367 RepID=UPI001915B252|nr:hypothetical protein [Ktedonobacter sp. SOSP1-85]GHO80784.1 hypothetical protein KSD_85550 [Ktedonobacter sp. SOSP1-85]